MEPSLERIREAAHWCNRLEEVETSYERLDKYLAKISTVSYNVMHYILHTTGFFIVGILIWVMVPVVYNDLLHGPYGRLPRFIFNETFSQELLYISYHRRVGVFFKFLPVVVIILLPLSITYGVYTVKYHLKRTQIRCAKKKKELTAIVNTKMELIQLIPDKYRYKSATDFIVEVFETDRASTMKEALALYDKQLH